MLVDQCESVVFLWVFAQKTTSSSTMPVKHYLQNCLHLLSSVDSCASTLTSGDKSSKKSMFALVSFCAANKMNIGVIFQLYVPGNDRSKSFLWKRPFDGNMKIPIFLLIFVIFYLFFFFTCFFLSPVVIQSKK